MDKLQIVGWCALGGAITLGSQLLFNRMTAKNNGAAASSKASAHHRLSEAEGAWAENSRGASVQSHPDGRGTKVFRICLTGGPCGGKSSSLAHLKKVLNKIGYDVYAVPECPTLLMNGGCKYPGMDGGKRLAEFEGALIELQLQLGRSYTRIAASTGRPSVVITDRGLLDIKAYLPAFQWEAVLAAACLDEEYLLKRYDAVLHLTTAADGAEAFYRHGNTADDSGNAVYREETPEAARMLDHKVRGAWKAHPRHGVISNLDDGFQGKLARASGFVTCLIGGEHSSSAL